ncbi:hypothetical protein PMF13cell1_04704 [Blautia producta]|uniref:Uncharacterized protein n=1 Tax=Blautia producta TaxID=33035 RepID=A0A4P6M1W9_9FIRM|nr:hypothetical protein PMF13cell1_04704 [Blautia producta]
MAGEAGVPVFPCRKVTKEQESQTVVNSQISHKL